MHLSPERLNSAMRFSLSPLLTAADIDDAALRITHCVDKLRQSASDRPATIAHIKEELIGRGKDFIIKQRLSAAKDTVVLEGSIDDDPLIRDPMQLVSVGYEDPNTLVFILNHDINDRWAHALRNMGSYSSVFGNGPERFQLRGNRATIPADEHEVNETIRYFKEWLPKANEKYRQLLLAEKREREDQQREAAQNEIARLERLERIRKNLQNK